MSLQRARGTSSIWNVTATWSSSARLDLLNCVSFKPGAGQLIHLETSEILQH